MIFDGVDETLELVTANAVQTDWSVSYADHSRIDFTPDAAAGSILIATTTTIIAAPAVQKQRQLKYMTIRNAGLSNQTVTLRKSVVAVKTKVSPDIVLAPGETLQWLDGQGFSVLDPFGRRKVIADAVTLTATTTDLAIANSLSELIIEQKLNNMLINLAFGLNFDLNNLRSIAEQN